MGRLNRGTGAAVSITRGASLSVLPEGRRVASVGDVRIADAVQGSAGTGSAFSSRTDVEV